MLYISITVSESGTSSQSSQTQGKRAMQVVRHELKKTPIKTEEKINPEISKVLETKIELATREQKSATTSPVKSGILSVGTVETTKTRDSAISLQIWDFAGHELYYTTHQVQLLSRSPFSFNPNQTHPPPSTFRAIISRNFFRAPRFRYFFLSSVAQLLMLFS